MDERLSNLLRLVVEDTIETGEPVGSQRLVEAYRLDVSPATIRNWFAELDEQGYLIQPHTSSGRVPTEKGYQMYVQEMMTPMRLTKRETQAFDVAEDVKHIAKISSEIVGTAVFLGLGDDDSFYTGISRLFAQPEFHEWSRVVTLGDVLDRMDDVLRAVRRKSYAEPMAMIGGTCPFGDACGSVVVSLKDGTLFGLLGPMRMDYRKAVALANAAREKIS